MGKGGCIPTSAVKRVTLFNHLIEQRGFKITFRISASVMRIKVTYYEERMVEVEDELARVKEDRRQASIQVSVKNGSYHSKTVVFD